MIKWLLMTSLTGSIASLCLILFKTKLAAKCGGRWYYYVCLSALLLFIVPLSIKVPALIPQSLIPGTSAVSFTGNTATAIETKAMELPVRSSEGVPTDPFNFPVISSETWILGIWVSGFVIMLCLNFFNYFRFKRKALQGTSIDKVGSLNVLASPNVHSPMLIGFVKPQIVFPNTNMSTADYQLALRHELIHHKQKDAWLKLFAVIVNCLHWFNPVSYLALANVSEACEYAVDETLSKMMQPMDKKRYSEMILHFASQASPAFNSGLAQPKKQLYRRFKLIMNRSKGKGQAFSGIVIAVMIAAVSLFSSSVVFATASQPITEYSGGIKTYYNVNDTLEGNVQSTLGKTKMGIFTTDLYIDENGLKLDSFNRTEPYYKVGVLWKDKDDSSVAEMTTKTFYIQDRTVTVAFADKAAAYKEDSVIKKMIANQISFELKYSNKRYQYDHAAFIDEVIQRGVYVIYEIFTPKEFTFNLSKTKNGDMTGYKQLTAYDKKAKNTDIFNNSLKLPSSVSDENADGTQGVQLGKAFVIKSGETLALDVKETTDISPTISLAVIEDATGNVVYWNPAARSGIRSIFTPGESNVNRSFKIVASGEEEDRVKVEIFTYTEAL
ncbi:Signal transducer regulating beta-lactamase production, contains metallopeptidase domain [Paenibacillus sp. 1_12]|uniref:M56 family metallopeptidase n=1 Tax=Paenibacillus sp. 1_12 TaxID=1566278 RepID=UPI0008E860DA|nr:M56 family metallopeptidase [Paenibacillus sp. 1_12]SFL06617.1 Signal transducer regulating beta-lactamase production, contains metallopeptidase domain [Paenibacillus sp. 1_12]